MLVIDNVYLLLKNVKLFVKPIIVIFKGEKMTKTILVKIYQKPDPHIILINAHGLINEQPRYFQQLQHS